MIRGSGKTVYWKGCNVTVYDTDGEGNEQTTMLTNWPDGQGKLESGVKLYVTYGKVFEA
jgi:hypothetical protein